MTIHDLPHSEDEAAKALLHQARALLKKEDERKFFDALFAGAASEDVTRSNANALAQLRAPIYEDKVVDFILELANVTEKKVSREDLYKDDEDDKKTAA